MDNQQANHQEAGRDSVKADSPKNNSSSQTNGAHQQDPNFEERQAEQDANFAEDDEQKSEKSAQSELNLENFVPKFLYQSLEQENKTLKNKLDEVLSAHRRAVDEHQKMAERLKLDSEKQVDFKVIRIFRDFLDTIDNLDRTLTWSKQSQHNEVKNFGVGLEMIMSGFKEKLRSNQIEVLSLVGKAFDPAQAEAIEQIDVPKADQDGQILEESTKGYVYKGHLIRAAQVKVGRLGPKK